MAQYPNSHWARRHEIRRRLRPSFFESPAPSLDLAAQIATTEVDNRLEEHVQYVGIYGWSRSASRGDDPVHGDQTIETGAIESGFRSTCARLGLQRPHMFQDGPAGILNHPGHRTGLRSASPRSMHSRRPEWPRNHEGKEIS